MASVICCRVGPARRWAAATARATGCGPAGAGGGPATVGLQAVWDRRRRRTSGSGGGSCCECAEEVPDQVVAGVHGADAEQRGKQPGGVQHRREHADDHHHGASQRALLSPPVTKTMRSIAKRRRNRFFRVALCPVVGPVRCAARPSPLPHGAAAGASTVRAASGLAAFPAIGPARNGRRLAASRRPTENGRLGSFAMARAITAR